MSMDIIARGLATKAQNAIVTGNIPYAMSSSFDSGTVGSKLQDTLSVRDFGVAGDGKFVPSGAMTAGSATLTVGVGSFSGFTPADVGKLVCIPGAGVGGANLTTTIATFVSASTVTLSAAAGTTVSSKQVTFGTDDTAAVQACVNFIANNRLQAIFPAGVYCLNAAITTPHKHGWGISGQGPETTILSQLADNVAILDLGAGTVQAVDAGGLHTILLEDFRLSYAAQQPATNANAACLAFSSMVYWSTLRRIYFERGYDGIKVRASRPAPWGSNWDDLRFVSSAGNGYLTGCAMDWTGSVQGTPNNRWGRMVIEMGGMTKPAFNQIRGYSWHVEALEFLGSVGVNSAGGTGQQLMNFQAGSSCRIGAMKLEQFQYTGTHAFSGNSLIYAPSGVIHVGHLSFSGNSGNSKFQTTNALSIIGGAATHCIVDTFVTILADAPSNASFSGSSAGFIEVGLYHDNVASGWYPLRFTDIGSSAAADQIAYRRNAVRRISADIGNADYTLATNGGPTVIVAQTALSAPRTIELMPDVNCLFNGYTVTILSRGAVNGANTLTIKAGGITKATIASDNYAVEMTWRRHPTAHNGWVVTRQGTA